MSSTSRDNSKEPPKLDDGDPRLDTFLQKAAPVLAEHRGFTARTRVKLEAIARDMHLPDNLFDQAIHMLQGAPPIVSKNRWVEAFGRYLHAKLEQAPRHILTAEQQSRAVAVAISKYQLTETQAREVIREVTAERGIRRISQTEAERHVTELIEKKVGDSAWLDEQTVARLHAAGREWGLAEEQIDAIIRQHTQRNRRRATRERRTTVAALTGGGALVLALLGFLLYAVLVKDELDDESSGPDKPSDVASDRDARQRPVSIKPPAWWGKDLSLKMVQARLKVPTFDELYNSLASEQAEVRTAAYERLVRLCQTNPDGGKHAELLRGLVVQCHALEPQDSAAAVLRDQLIGLMTVDRMHLPADPAAYDHAFWALQTALAALTADGLSDDRAKPLETAIGRSLGTVVDRSANEVLQEKRCSWLLAKAFYTQLIDLAPSNPSLAQSLRPRLLGFAARYAGKPEQLDDLEAEFMAAIVPAVGAAWQPLTDLIESCIASSDPLNVLKVVEVYERSEHADLQAFIARRLLAQVRAAPRSGKVEDVAFAVREALGVAPVATTMTGRQRWDSLKPTAAAALERPIRSYSDPQPLVDETIRLAHLATLACAVAQQEPGFPLFDQLRNDGPPALGGESDESAFTAPDASPGDLVRRPTAAKLQELDERLTRMKDFESQLLAKRTTDIRGLARLTEFIEDIQPRQAAVIARYLLAEKDDYEQKKVFEAVAPLARWQSVLLALADQLVDAKASRFEIQQVLSAVLGRRVEVEDRSGWRFALREQLLRVVYEELSRQPATAASQDPTRIFGQFATAMQKMYATRARLLGATPNQYNHAASPADALQLALAQITQRLEAGLSDKRDEPVLAQLPHRYAVIDYLGTNDLRRTVLLQRVGLELLAAQIHRRRSDRAAEADAIVADLRNQDAAAEDLLLQLRDGEAATLKMWMLYAP